MSLLANASGAIIVLTGGAAIAVGGGAVAIVGVELPPDQIYQAGGLSGAAAQVSLSATYTGSAGTVQGGVVAFGTATRVGAWQTLAAAGGTAAGMVSVSRGGPYAVTVQDAGTGVAWTAGQRVYVGDNGVFYGQSNMFHLFSAGVGGYEASQPLGRRQAGAGWNVITNAVGETFSTTPPTVYGGKVDPALGLTGEPALSASGSVTQGQAMGWMAERIIHNTGSPLGCFPYAASGTDTSYWAPGSGSGWATMLGVSGSRGIFNSAPYAFDASFAVRYQGENNSSVAGTAAFPAALVAERNGWWAATGRSAASFRFGVVSLGPSQGYGVAGTFGQLRAAALAFIAAAANGAYYAGNPIDGVLPGSETVHIDQASLVRLAFRIALTTSIALGRTVVGSTGAFTTGAGPRITGITRSGNVLVLAVGDMDGSTALVTGDGGTSGSGIGGFRVFDSIGMPVAIASTAIVAASVRLTLPAGVSYPINVDHQMADAPYGQPPVAAQIVYGNNLVPGDTIGAPLWPSAPVSVA